MGEGNVSGGLAVEVRLGSQFGAQAAIDFEASAAWVKRRFHGRFKPAEQEFPRMLSSCAKPT